MWDLNKKYQDSLWSLTLCIYNYGRFVILVGSFSAYTLPFFPSFLALVYTYPFHFVNFVSTVWNTIPLKNILNTETSLRLAISIWQHQSLSPEVAPGAGHCLLLQGLGKAHHNLWQICEQIQWHCKKRKEWCPNVTMCLSCLHLLCST